MTTTALLLALLAAGPAQETQATPQAPAETPVFGAEVGLVALDVTVVDEGGRPVSGLSPQDFVISVEGRPRRVVTVEFIAAAAEARAAEPPPAPVAGLASNEGAAPGRLVLIAVDQGLIAPMSARAVTDAAGRLLDRLTPADRVGLITFPQPGPSVDFTADREAVRAALKQVVGHSDLRRRRMTIAEAVAFDQRRDQYAWEQALQRECNTTSRDGELCVMELESEARQVANEFYYNSRISLDVLRAAFESLARLDGAKSVVLISQGLSAEFRGELRELGEKAAESRASLYVLQIEEYFQDIAMNRRPGQLTRDEPLLEEGLDMLAALSRGQRFRVVGSGGAIFDRVARELSGYYLVGFEPEAQDRDGKLHDVKVKVAREGLTVRSRRVVRIPPPDEARPSDEERLARVLSSPLVATELPLRAAAYATREAAGGRVRLIVSAAIGAAGEPQPAAAVGLRLLNGRGESVFSRFKEAPAKPPEGPGPSPFLGAAEVDPGEYTLRVAAIDGRGRSGSIDLPVKASLVAVGDLELSDLMLGEPPAPQTPFRPRATLAAGEQGVVAGYIEVHGASERLAQVQLGFELAGGSGGPALVVGRALPEGERREGQRMLGGAASTLLLPPGDYRARALIRSGAEVVGAVEAPFRLRPSAERGGSGQLSRLTAAQLVGPVDVGPLLAPERVLRALEALPLPAGAGVSATLGRALDDVQAGRLDRLVDALQEEQAAEAAPLFLRGLGFLARGQARAAVKQLEGAEKAGFAPAAAYLGAALAAVGQDGPAAAAFSRALTGEPGDPLVAVLLADACLRIGLGERAEGSLRQALERRPGDPQLEQRLGLVLAASGRADEALPLLERVNEARPDDVSTMFALLRLYEASGRGEAAGLERRLGRWAGDDAQRSALAGVWSAFLGRARS